MVDAIGYLVRYGIEWRALPADFPRGQPFGWLMRYRGLVRDDERRPEHHEATVRWATTVITTRGLARELAHAPLHPRWGSKRSPTAQPTRPAT
jgi:transposase